MDDLEHLKQEAAERAVDAVRSGMRVGLGTGSTARWAIVSIGRRLAAGQLAGVVGVATSGETEALARAAGVPLEPLDARALDVAIDGADEISPTLELIKGRGGALVRERLVALQAREFIVVADHTKRVQRLGEKNPVPLEVLAFGYEATLARVQRLCGVAPRLRRGADGTPLRSDNGNLLADLALGVLEDPAAQHAQLESVPGVVDCGLFLGMAHRALVAYPDGVRSYARP
ncbi:ribose 5-phosphate isomerase A [Aggregicoccus sp. 17bor-14]|uniref:ribose 5-phosphate isomerase A n=1 Tax=Myxococcaceae TaxID=31 RepID=UPI00129CDC9D|nr:MULTISPECIES: ribose 5-phosphate isomerase A [Myxococcaceae]MBF5043146.1 ribose 5-phosphate isomerase A [Simulacricoccus sp. 17bor-14]MRI88906.1 ribose 5-phosphate isomerase A [Aggregicoccus sp. 17bor-14]